MNTQQAIVSNLNTARFIMTSYLSDLSDAELVVRPVPGAHHAAWQLGHLVLSECQMIRSVCPDLTVEMPPDFIARHDKAKATANATDDFFPKDTYVSLMNRVRSVTLSAVERFSADDLSKPGPEAMRAYAPTVGSVFLAIANHEILHCGQLAVLRRSLGKPVLI
jgi:hypothetical protein